MANVNIPLAIPDNLIVPAGKMLARRLGEQEPTTNQQRIALMGAFLKASLKEAYIEDRAQQAAVSSRADDSDGALTW